MNSIYFSNKRRSQPVATVPMMLFDPKSTLNLRVEFHLKVLQPISSVIFNGNIYSLCSNNSISTKKKNVAKFSFKYYISFFFLYLQ